MEGVDEISFSGVELEIVGGFWLASSVLWHLWWFVL